MKQNIENKQYKKWQRLYVSDTDFLTGNKVVLRDGQAHYLRNVMRCKVGDSFRLFNGEDGEFKADVKSVNKKEVLLVLLERLREQSATPDLWAFISPVKKDAFDCMVQKATELGVSKIYPVICDHTVTHRIKPERMELIVIEAAEQSERLDVPKIMPLEKLSDILQAWPEERILIAGLERSSAPSVAGVLQDMEVGQKLAILIGPEGGFSNAESDMLIQAEYCCPVSLGVRILRADTAVVSLLSCVQAICGDWK